MPITNPNKPITKQDLSDFYQGILPYLGGKADAGFTPIGTVISIFGESAPANYLICDGATYNVADYPELCAHLWSLTTNSQYKVSGDDTKFKVPDLRGEFLRGTGTNSHAKNGNGASVGVHQDSTLAPIMRGSTAYTDIVVGDGSSDQSFVSNQDGIYKNVSGSVKWTRVAKSSEASTGLAGEVYSSRPTNTSVLFCIATKNIYLNPANDYSTEEKVVGTWIDGSTIYQRTIVLDTGLSFDKGDTFKNFDILDCSDKYIIDAKGTFEYLYLGNRSTAIIGNDYYDPTKTDYTRYMSSYIQKPNSSAYTADYLVVSIAQGIASAVPNPSALSLDKITVTVQYTKTTD